MAGSPNPGQEIIFIGGSGRSGSTLLDRMIGQVPDITSAGEIRDVWRAGVLENRLCGCGLAFHDCPFWSRVGAEGFGGWSNVDPIEAERLLASFGHRDVLRSPRGVRALPDQDDRARLLGRLYHGIATASETSVLVDSSKSPAYGALLAAVFPGRVRAVHLVRDPRGVAYSWGQHVRRPDTPGRDIEMPRLSATGVAARWIVHNGMMEVLARRIPVARLRYEALLEQPAAELSRVLAAIERAVDADALAFVSDRSVELGAAHTVMGNPMRMSVGPMPLRLDDRWRAGLSRLDRVAVTVLTWPMMLRYGYRP